jgi:hypothetical protein
MISGGALSADERSGDDDTVSEAVRSTRERRLQPAGGFAVMSVKSVLRIAVTTVTTTT